MKKIIFSILTACISVGIYAGPTDDTPFTVIQPNGDTITIRLKGDEFGSWYEDSHKQVIMKNDAGLWVYAQADNGMIKPSDVAVSDKMRHSVTQAGNATVKEIIIQNRLQCKNQLYNWSSGDTASQKGSRIISSDKAGVPLPSSGNAKILTILVQFSDIKFQGQNNDNTLRYYTDLFNSSRLPTATCPATGESVTAFWKKASYNKLNLTSVVLGPYTAPKTRSYYGSRNKELIEFAADMAANDIDMSQFDNNGDGWVEGICVIYAGEGRDVNSYDNNDFIHPHQGYISRKKKDGVYISQYCCSAELYVGSRRGIGTVCHELGHLMGAMDFYDNDADGSGGEYNGTVRMDLMAGGSWNNGTKSPAHPNPWLKAYLWGWSTVQEISGTNRLYTLYPTETGANRIYRLTSAGGDFFLLENKQQDYINDNYGGSNKGLVIFHVHKDMNNAAGSTFWKSNEVNTGHPQRVYVIDPNSEYPVPTGSVESYSGKFANRSFTSNMRPLFTSTTKPNNLGWSQQTLSSPKNITMIREEIAGGEKVIRFVLNPVINGDYKFCNDEVFSIDNVPSNATTDWGIKTMTGQYVAQSGLKVASANRSSATYVRDGLSTLNPSTGEITTSYSYGKRTLTAKVSMFGQSYDMTKEVDLVEFKNVKFKLSELSSKVFYPGSTRTFCIENPVDGPEGNISWIVSGSAMHSTKVLSGVKIAVAPDKVGQMTVTVIDGNGCAPYNETSSSYRVLDLAVIIPVNPAQGTAEFSVVLRSDGNPEEDDSDAVTAMFTGRYNSVYGCYEEPYDGAYRIELWHKQYGMVRSVNMAEGNPDTQMNIAGLSPGDYIVRLIVDGNVTDSAQLRVK